MVFAGPHRYKYHVRYNPYDDEPGNGIVRALSPWLSGRHTTPQSWSILNVAVKVFFYGFFGWSG
jgi:hypothetical protein